MKVKKICQSILMLQIWGPNCLTPICMYTSHSQEHTNTWLWKPLPPFSPLKKIKEFWLWLWCGSLGYYGATKCYFLLQFPLYHTMFTMCENNCDVWSHKKWNGYWVCENIRNFKYSPNLAVMKLYQITQNAPFFYMSILHGFRVSRASQQMWVCAYKTQ